MWYRHLLVNVLLVVLLCIGIVCHAERVAFRIENSRVPESCDAIAKPTDHLMLEFDIIAANGTSFRSVKLPSQLFHTILGEPDEYSLNGAINGICKNETRRVVWSSATDVNLSPILPVVSSYSSLYGSLTVEVTVHHITPADEYEIFAALKEGNISLAFDMLEVHKGVNAVDEFGQTPLMIAIINKYPHIIAELLNTRRPTVDINLAKHSGFTALFYAVQHSSPSVFHSLLRRGADATMVTSDHRNTPLHYACLLEKPIHADLLLQYGANPSAVNSHGNTPLQLLPASAVPSVRLNFKKVFEGHAKALPGKSSARSDL